MGWQITDTRDVVVDSSMPRSDTESEHSEQSSDDIPMQDEGYVSDLEDTDNAHIPKVSTTTWFKPILEGERPAIPEPKWTIPPNDFHEPENNRANTYTTTYKVPTENKFQRKTYNIGPSDCEAVRIADANSQCDQCQDKASTSAQTTRLGLHTASTCGYETEHPSETMVFHNEDGNPARANIKQALGRPHKGVKASANSDIMYFFTSAQDGDLLQDDVRLCLGDDLKKAQDHNQTQV
ncbi:hypothetical protein Tco_0754379 [Tanacetum coccineum]